MEKRIVSRIAALSLAILLALGTTASLSAQLTREQILEEGKKHPPLPRLSNLQVLPRDIAVPDLIVTMVRFSEGLGVQCTYCHAFTPDHKDLDFASDAKPEKLKARTMLRMANDINGKFLAELPAPHKGTEVGCGTCHQGQAVPPAYKPPPDYKLQ
jgi:hypothetical protein